jgi:hypothetical protein
MIMVFASTGRLSGSTLLMISAIPSNSLSKTSLGDT